MPRRASTSGRVQNFPRVAWTGPPVFARETELRNLYEVKTLVNYVCDPIVSALLPHARGAQAENIMAIRAAR